MKVMQRIGLLVGVFAFAMAGIYGYFTAQDRTGFEPLGVTGLILGGLVGFMIAFAMWLFLRKLPPAPEDDLHGEIDDIAGEYGFFSPHSWQPLFLAASTSLLFLGLAMGWWIFFIGLVFVVPALVGWVFEYWKGPHAL